MAHLFELSFTRPENTTAYGAGDVVGVADSDTAANAGSAVHVLRGGDSGGLITRIVGVDFLIGADAVPAGMTSFTMHLYGATPPSALLDNAAWDLPSGDRSAYIGSVTLGTPADIGGTLFIQTTGLDKYVRMAPSAILYAYIVTAAGYTPASATSMIVRMYAQAPSQL